MSALSRMDRFLRMSGSTDNVQRRADEMTRTQAIASAACAAAAIEPMQQLQEPTEQFLQASQQRLLVLSEQTNQLRAALAAMRQNHQAKSSSIAQLTEKLAENEQHTREIQAEIEKLQAILEQRPISREEKILAARGEAWCQQLALQRL